MPDSNQRQFDNYNYAYPLQSNALPTELKSVIGIYMRSILLYVDSLSFFILDLLDLLDFCKYYKDIQTILKYFVFHINDHI